MTVGLPISSIVAVQVALTPQATPIVNLNTLLILGDSDVIDVKQRLRTYTLLSQVANDFGTTAPEYLAASLYFGQTPVPQTLYIGRWAKIATRGLALGGTLSAAQQAIGNFSAITTGGFRFQVDGGALTQVTGINLTGVTNLNGVASQIQAAIQGLGGPLTAVTCVWNGSQFLIKSGTTGPASSISALQAPTVGTDLSGLLLMTANTLTYVQGGIAAESAVSAAVIFDTQVTTPWYELMFAAGANNVDIADSDHLAVAAYIEGAGTPHLYGLTTSAAAALTSPDTTSIGAQLAALKYNRTLVQWSSQNPFAVSSVFGRMNSVNFAGVLTTIELMFKTEPGVVPELFNTTQQAALNSSNYNYYATYNNNASIIVNGQVASGQFIDTVWGVDGLAGQIQANVFNLLFTSPTKIPQTDAGMNQLNSSIAAGCEQYNQNGFLGTGVWTGPQVGQLKSGQTVPKGYYIFQPPISSLSPAARAARQSVPFTVAAKLAGAVQSVNVLIQVNP